MRKYPPFMRHNTPAVVTTAVLLFLVVSLFSFSMVSGVTTISTNVTTDGFIRATTTADTVFRLSNSTGTNNLFTLFDDTTQIFNVANGGTASGTVIVMQEGAVGAPAYSFARDTNTGIFSSALDTLDFTAGGTTELSITTATSTFSDSIVADTSVFIVNANENRVGIGTASPTTTLGVLGAARINGTLRVTDTGTIDGTLTLGGNLILENGETIGNSTNDVIFLNGATLALATSTASTTAGSVWVSGVTGTATTTLQIGGNDTVGEALNAANDSCMQLWRDGAVYRVYLNASTTDVTTSGIILVVQPGVCRD